MTSHLWKGGQRESTEERPGRPRQPRKKKMTLCAVGCQALVSGTKRSREDKKYHHQGRKQSHPYMEQGAEAKGPISRQNY
jgi:hypothetical protein